VIRNGLRFFLVGLSPQGVITAVILLFLCGASHGDGLAVGMAPVQPGPPISRIIQYGFTVQNKKNYLVTEAEFWTYAPVKLTSTQRCITLEVSHPYQLIVDDLGNQILHFRFKNFPPHAVKTINVTAVIEVSDTAIQALFNNSNQYLKPENYVESNDPEMCQLAKSLKAQTIRQTAENIFRWVADNVRYEGYLKDNRGALYAFKNRRGDCTEYMFLFTALCRANNIPARGIGGYVCKENGILEPSSYHNWAEFYEGGAWRTGDPQKRIFIKNSSHYIAMRIIATPSNNPMGESHRFRVSGDEIEAKMITSRGFEGI
jgi:hypothetical protein